MINNPQMWGSAVAAFLAVSIYIVNSFLDGGIRGAIQVTKNDGQNDEFDEGDMASVLDEVSDDVKYTRNKLENVDDKVEHVDNRVDRISRAMIVIHKHSHFVDEDELRKRLDVDALDDDLIREEDLEDEFGEGFADD